MTAGPLLSEVSAFLCMTGDHYQVIILNDGMENFTGLEFVCITYYNSLQLLRQRKRVLVMPVNPGHYGLLDVPAPGETSACPLCFVRLSVFPCLMERSIAEVVWRGNASPRIKNNPCRVVMGS